MTISETTEVESTFEVGPDTPMPTAGGLAPLIADEPVIHHLTATYYDTEDLALSRHKVTLRRRTGGDDAGWHLKLPVSAGRLELRAPLGEADETPTQLLDAVAGLIRHRPLVQVARIDNERRLHLLRHDGRAVIELSDDHVTTESYVGTTGGGNWREWEAELVDPDGPDGPEHMAVVARACERAGASPSSSSSKLARALGPLPARHDVGHSPIRDALDEDLQQLLGHDPAARRGTMTGVHKMRVAARGLRSTISSYAGELGEATADSDVDPAALHGELKVLAAVLGKLRDIQVVEGRLDTLIGEYPPDLVSETTRDRIRTVLTESEDRARHRVRAALVSDRYLDLLDGLHRLVELAGPTTTDDAPSATAVDDGGSDAPKSLSAKERRRSEELLLRGVDRQFEKFTKVRTRTERDLDSLDLTLAQREELTHVVRKRAKALRRGVASLPDSGDLRVAPLRTACQRLHTVLGDVQDSVTSRDWLRRITRRAESAGESTFGLGVLYERERAFSEQALAGFEEDAATVTAAYRELSQSRRAARRKKSRGKSKAKGKKKS